MARLRTTLGIALAVALAAPSLAAAAQPNAQPLVAQARLGSYFKDRVITSSSPLARASRSGTWRSYPIKDGSSVSLAISDRYANILDANVAWSYVAFFDSLDQGTELSARRIFVAPPDEVVSECGGQAGTLACYDSRAPVMGVPGEEPETGGSGGPHPQGH